MGSDVSQSGLLDITAVDVVGGLRCRIHLLARFEVRSLHRFLDGLTDRLGLVACEHLTQNYVPVLAIVVYLIGR